VTGNLTGVKCFGRIDVGERVQVEANAVMYGPVKVGDSTFIGPNTVLGFPSKKELSEAVIQGKIFHENPDRAILIIGRGCIIRAGVCLYSGVFVHDSVLFGHNTTIREDTVIGARTTIGTNVVVDGSCKIGEHVSVQTGAYVCPHSVIEDAVFLGPHVVLADDKYVTQRKTKLIGPTIRRGASVGANALLMPGVEIGAGAVIGAYSLVMHDVPPRTIYAGVPASRLKKVPANWHSSLL